MNVRQAISAITGQPEQFTLLKDWQLLQQLNQFSGNTNPDSTGASGESICQQLELAEIFLKENLQVLDLPFQIPTVKSIAVLYPLQLIG